MHNYQTKKPVLIFVAGALASLSCVKRDYNSSPKIVAGSLVEENDPIYASTVSLDWDGKPNCTGFVLDKRTIVTAAHCLATLRSGVVFSVTFGSRNRNLKKTVEVPSAQVMAHPGWDRGDLNRKDIEPLPQNPKNDIGVIVLGEDAPEWVKPLPVKEIGDIVLDNDVILAGYGQTRPLPDDTPAAEFSGFLRKVQVKLAQINLGGKELIWQAPSDNARASSCHGDSGGPMFYKEQDGSLTVIGVTSRSFGAQIDCREKGVYTDVRQFIGWIRTTKEKLASGVVRTDVWLHRNFTANDGSKIALDYRLQRVGADHNASEVWINISNDKFNGSEKVSAKLSSYINSLLQEELKLDYAGEKRFTAKFAKFTNEKVCAIGSRWGIKQDVSIQIEGKSLRDQSNNSDGFVFKFCE